MVGTSFSTYLRAVRLRNVAALLASQPLTVRQVALLVGHRRLRAVSSTEPDFA